MIGVGREVAKVLAGDALARCSTPSASSASRRATSPGLELAVPLVVDRAGGPVIAAMPGPRWSRSLARSAHARIVIVRFAPLPWVPFTRTAILCFPAREALERVLDALDAEPAALVDAQLVGLPALPAQVIV